jgi:hypothetical protein
MIFTFTLDTHPFKKRKASASIDVIATPDGFWIDIPPALKNHQPQ